MHLCVLLALLWFEVILASNKLWILCNLLYWENAWYFWNTKNFEIWNLSRIPNMILQYTTGVSKTHCICFYKHLFFCTHHQEQFRWCQSVREKKNYINIYEMAACRKTWTVWSISGSFECIKIHSVRNDDITCLSHSLTSCIFSDICSALKHAAMSTRPKLKFYHYRMPQRMKSPQTITLILLHFPSNIIRQYK